MHHSAQAIDRTTGNQVLDEVVEKITKRLQAGEAVAVEDYTRDHPELVERLGKLLPGMKMLAELGHTSDGTPSWSDADASDPEQSQYGVLGGFQTPAKRTPGLDRPRPSNRERGSWRFRYGLPSFSGPPKGTRTR